MTQPDPRRQDDSPFPIGFTEFVVLIAALMVTHSLGIDMMLPALPLIGKALDMGGANEPQLIVSVYMIGFGAGQLVYGPLADRFGRRPVLLPALIAFFIAGFVASIATSSALMLAARFVQGAMGAAGRVLAVSIVRDRYEGRTMARVMSLAAMVFMIGPILAPTLGQLVMLFGPWRLIFRVFSLFALLVAGWIWLRLPETLAPENQRRIEVASILGALGMILRNRISMGYTLANTMMFGAVLGFVSSSQQIFSDALGVPEKFALGFGLSSSAMAMSALTNSRIVERLGSRRVSHTAIIGMMIVTALHMAWQTSQGDSFASFMTFQCLTMFCLGLTGSNFNAMAMEPMGTIAGTASSVQGTISTIGAALISIEVGQHFDGTTLPVTLGFFVCAMLSLMFALFAERGRLFRPHHAPQ